MAGWGLVGSATANAPLQTLEELIASQQMKDEATRKAAIEQRKLGQDDQRIGIDAQRAGFEGQRVGLERDKFIDTQTQRSAEDQAFESLLAEAQKSQPWLVPVLKAKRAAGVALSPVDAVMSPEAQRTQQLSDDAAKQATALKNAQALRGTPTYGELHPKKPAVEVDPFLATGPVLSGFSGPNAQQTSGVGRDGGATDEAFLKTLPPQLAIKVKMLADGTFPVPTGAALKDPGLQQAIILAKRYDPSFEGANYANRAATQQAFTKGKQGDTIANINSVLGHIAGLDKSVEGLRNFDFGPASSSVNWLKNAIFRGGQANDPDINSFEENANLASSELSKVYTGSEGSQADRANARAPFSQYGAPESNKAAIKKALELLTSKLHSVEDQYQRGMGGKRFTVRELMSPEARDAYDSLMKKYGGDESTKGGSSTELLPPNSHFSGMAPGNYKVPKSGGGEVTVHWDGKQVSKAGG